MEVALFLCEVCFSFWKPSSETDPLDNSALAWMVPNSSNSGDFLTSTG